MRIRKFLYGIIAITAALTAAAQADEPVRVQVVNNSYQTIDYVQVSPVAAPNWGPDALGPDHMLRHGDAVSVTPFGTGCFFDIRVTYHDGSREEARAVNLCETNRVTFNHSDNFVRK